VDDAAVVTGGTLPVTDTICKGFRRQGSTPGVLESG
jgi:hypothetical protein